MYLIKAHMIKNKVKSWDAFTEDVIQANTILLKFMQQ